MRKSWKQWIIETREEEGEEDQEDQQRNERGDSGAAFGVPRRDDKEGVRECSAQLRMRREDHGVFARVGGCGDRRLGRSDHEKT